MFRKKIITQSDLLKMLVDNIKENNKKIGTTLPNQREVEEKRRIAEMLEGQSIVSPKV